MCSDTGGHDTAPRNPGGTPLPTSTPTSYNGTGADSPRWWPSRYGADDRLGAGNELTAERTLEAIRLVREGRVIELSHVLERGVPVWGSTAAARAEGPRLHQTILAHGQLEAFAPAGSQVGFFEESVHKTYHVGTHIDAIGHIGIAGRYYNGLEYKKVFAPSGMRSLGAEMMRPWVSRGVLLDIARVMGVEMLEEGFVITPEHLAAACERQDVEVRAGDAVLLHTGYGALWMVDNDRYGTHEPGIGWEAAHWLTDRRISVVGADTSAVEVLPGEHADKPFAVHQHLLTETGTFMIENLNTAELVASGAAEFLFLCLPIKHRGATGSQISPVAVL